MPTKTFEIKITPKLERLTAGEVLYDGPVKLLSKILEVPEGEWINITKTAKEFEVNVETIHRWMNILIAKNIIERKVYVVNKEKLG